MLNASLLKRVFMFKERENEIVLADPDPSFSVEEVMNFYSGTYPSLTTARAEGPEISGDAVRYQFLTTLGTKG
jgi:PRTRC genetic system protein C